MNLFKVPTLETERLRLRPFRRVRSESLASRARALHPLVLDFEVGPERPADDLGLGAAFFLRPRFKQAGLVLVEVAHLPDEPGSGEGLPGSFRLLALRHARKDTGFGCLL